MVRGTSFAVAVSVLLAVAANRAEQRAPAGGPDAGPLPVNAYAYADCSQSNTPTVRVVIVTGAIPAAIPAATPQPSVVLVFNASVDGLATLKSVAVSAGAANGGSDALALSCPVVGECVPASAGTINVQRRAADNALFGSYQATWPGGQPRMGRFTAAWRESQKRCS